MRDLNPLAALARPVVPAEPAPALRPPITSPGNLAVLASFLIFGTAGATAVIGESESSFVLEVWCLGLVCSGLLVAFFSDRRFDAFSPSFFLGASFAVLYGAAGLAPVYADSGGRFIRLLLPYFQHFPESAMAAYLGLAGFWAGYAVLWPAARFRGSRVLSWRASGNAMLSLWALTFAASVLAALIFTIATAFFQGSAGVASPLFQSSVGFLYQGFTIAVPIALAMALLQGGRMWKGIATLSLVSFILFGFVSGSKTLAILGFVFLGIAFNYCRRRFSRGLTASLFIALIVGMAAFFPINVLYRDSIQSSPPDPSASVVESAWNAYGEAIAEARDLGWDDFGQLSLDYLATRLSNISVVANIVGITRTQDALLWGETYARIVYALIPRFLWPDKPALSISGALTVTLGYDDAEAQVLGESVSSTAVGITLIGELLLNFPMIFVPFGMLLIGLVYRWMYETFLLGLRFEPAIAVSMYSSLWYSAVFTAHESNLASVAAGALKITLVILAVLWLLGARRAAVPS